MSTEKIIERSPVVAIMGHVDHGKSTLLDYIRKTNIVAGEAGGITQHLSTYEVESNGKRITFIDTPGHAAFNEMRNRSGSVADIAVLIVSAEDGVKMQTKHAIEVIKKNNIPYIVAINKIDKPNAQPDRVKTELMEEAIYVEGYGGSVPVCMVSAKSGIGIDELLETILLLAEMEEMTGDAERLSTGFVIEANRDPKEGISATLIIKNGTIKRGQFVVVDDTITPTRMLRNFKGENIESAYFSTPIQLVGFDKLPPIGSSFHTFETKKDAEQAILEFKEIKHELGDSNEMMFMNKEGVAIVPIILKTDVAGTAEAIVDAINKESDGEVIFKVLKSESGDFNESDVKLAVCDTSTIMLGFHVNEDPKIKGLNEYDSLTIKHFSVIYELTDYLKKLYEERRIKKEVDVIQAEFTVLKTFSRQKDASVIGGRVGTGILKLGQQFKIVRRDEEVGKGTVTGLQAGKIATDHINAGDECGAMVNSKVEIEEGDILKSFIREIQ